MTFLPDDLLKITGGFSAADLIYGDDARNATTQQKFYKQILEKYSGCLADTDSIINVLGKESSGDGKWLGNSQVADYYTIKKGQNGYDTNKVGYTADAVTAVRIRDASFLPGLVDSRKSTLFLNFMPNLSLAQLSPYLEVEFQYPADEDVTLAGQKPIGMLRFLLGSEKIDKTQRGNLALFDGALGNLKTTSKEGDTEETRYSYFGMEMFTSPVTLVNPRPSSNLTDVLNPYAPFATLTNVQINNRSAGSGIYDIKEGSLTFTIHDKTRLPEIADFLRPELFSKNTLWINYGWRASTVTRQDDPFCKFVNENMMSRESFVVVNASYTVKDKSVDVNMKFVNKGPRVLDATPLTHAVGGADRNINLKNTVVGDQRARDIQETVSKLLSEAARGITPAQLAEIRGQTLITSAISLTFPEDLNLNQSLESLEKTLAKNGKLGLYAQLRDQLIKLYSKGNDKKYVVATSLQKNISANVTKLFDDLLGDRDPKADAFLEDPGQYLKLGTEDLYGSSQTSSVKKWVSKKGARVASYGAIFNKFILPVIRLMPGLTEVQVFWYNLNDTVNKLNTGRTCNISEFPIDIAQLIDDYEKACVAKGGELLSVGEFLSLLNNQVSDPKGLLYNMRQNYSITKESGVGYAKGGQQVIDEWQKNVKMPNVSLTITSGQIIGASGPTPVDTLLFSESARSLTGNARREAIRLEIYDSHANDAVQQAIATRNNQFFVAPEPGKGDPDAKLQVDQVKQYLEAAGLGDRIKIITVKVKDPSDNTEKEKYQLSFSDSRAVKDLFTRRMPYIIIGAQGSGVTSFTMETKGVDPQIQASLIVKSTTNTPAGTPAAATPSFAPINVLPAGANMTTIGCPLFRYGQVFFIDGNTGTTLDNVYRLVGINHTFEQGKFGTSLQFVIDSGVQAAFGPRDLADILDVLKKT